MFPAMTGSPPKRLMPRRWAFESRPFRVEPAPFFEAKSWRSKRNMTGLSIQGPLRRRNPTGPRRGPKPKCPVGAQNEGPHPGVSPRAQPWLGLAVVVADAVEAAVAVVVAPPAADDDPSAVRRVIGRGRIV